MTAPQGHWRIVAAGFQGDLNLTADAQGNIHGTVEIDQEIPEEHYKAVAEIIGYVMGLNRAFAR